MNILELSEQEIVRRNNLQALRDLGIDPYPAAEYPTNAFSTDIRTEFKDEDEDEPREVCIAGRIMSKRIMGKASFAELMDSKGRIQVYITRDDLCPDAEDTTLYNTVWKKMILLNNNFLGNVRQWQYMFFNKRYSSTPMTNPDFVRIAEAYNIPAATVTERKDLDKAIQTMLDTPGAYLLQCAVKEEDNVLPMTPPGANVDEMLLEIK